MLKAVMPVGSPVPPDQRCFCGVIGVNVNDVFTIPTNGAPSIGFHLTPPTGGKVTFEGSWDGAEWTTTTLREMGSNGYTSRSSAHEDYVGSIAAFTYFRVRTTLQGSEAGAIKGRLTAAPTTLEGIEHGFAPHNIGHDVQAATFAYNAIVTNGTVAMPLDTTHRLVVSDIHFTVTGAASTVTFSDGSLVNNRWLFRGQLKPGGGASEYVPINFSLPHVFSGSNRPLCISSTGAAEIDGVVHYYEAE